MRVSKDPDAPCYWNPSEFQLLDQRVGEENPADCPAICLLLGELKNMTCWGGYWRNSNLSKYCYPVGAHDVSSLGTCPRLVAWFNDQEVEVLCSIARFSGNILVANTDPGT